MCWSHASYKLVTCWWHAGHEQLVRCLHSGHVQIWCWVHANHVLINCTPHADYMQVMHRWNGGDMLHMCGFYGGHMRVMCWLVVRFLLLTCSLCVWCAQWHLLLPIITVYSNWSQPSYSQVVHSWTVPVLTQDCSSELSTKECSIRTVFFQNLFPRLFLWDCLCSKWHYDMTYLTFRVSCLGFRHICVLQVSPRNQESSSLMKDFEPGVNPKP